VAIVDHGKVIALGTPAELIARIGGEHLIEFVVAEGPELVEDELRVLPAVVSVRREEEAFVLAVTAPHQTLPALLEKLQAVKRKLNQRTTDYASLQDVFVTLTGRHLRDENT